MPRNVLLLFGIFELLNNAYGVDDISVPDLLRYLFTNVGNIGEILSRLFESPFYFLIVPRGFFGALSFLFGTLSFLRHYLFMP